MITLQGKLEYLALQLNQADLLNCGREIQHLVEADLSKDFLNLFKRKKPEAEIEIKRDIFSEDYLEDTREHPVGFDPEVPWNDDLVDGDPAWERMNKLLRNQNNKEVHPEELEIEEIDLSF